MKLILAGPVPPPYGGIAVYLLQLLQNLQLAGVRCKVVDTGLTHNRRSWREVMRRLGNYLSNAAKVWRTSGDIVHCLTGGHRGIYAAGFLALAGRLSGKRVVFSFMTGDICRVIKQVGRVERAIIRFVIRLADKVIASNMDIQQSLLDMGLAPSAVIHLSNALPRVEQRRAALWPDGVREFFDSHHPIIVATGAFYPVYGLDIFIQAVAALPPSFSRVGLLLIIKEGSDQQYEAQVRDLLEEMRLSSQTLLVQNIPDVPTVVAHCDLFVRPTLTDGDSLSVREALMVGVPVVASNVGLRPNGVILFQAGSWRDLTIKMTEVLTSQRHGDSSRPKLALEGETNLRRLLEVYGQLIS